MNTHEATFIKPLFTIHYRHVNDYLDKPIKSFTGEELFYDYDNAIKFLTLNGFKKNDNIKYDMIKNIGSVNSYATIKEMKLYDYQ